MELKQVIFYDGFYLAIPPFHSVVILDDFDRRVDLHAEPEARVEYVAIPELKPPFVVNLHQEREQ